MISVFERRLVVLREKMRQFALDAVFLMISSDLQYLTGIPREPSNPTNDNKHGDELYGAFITLDSGPIIVAPRMGASGFISQQAADKPWITEIIVLNDGDQLLPFTKQLLAHLRYPKRIGVSGRLWTRSALLLQEADPEIFFTDASRFISQMRAIKDAEETAIMREAGTVTDKVFAAVLDKLQVGMTQYEIAREIDHQIIMHGGSGNSFHTSVYVTGEGIKWVPGPDGKKGFTPLQPGAVIAFDFGVVFKGYASDFGRTVFCGEPKLAHRRYHDYVMQSQAAAITAMRAGIITASELNTIARQIMDSGGYGSYFTHRLGHGIGIDVHEAPFLYELDNTILRNGMCFTIEPSIWVPNGPLIRVEDVVQVTFNGGVPFSNFSRELLVI